MNRETIMQELLDISSELGVIEFDTTKLKHLACVNNYFFENDTDTKDNRFKILFEFNNTKLNNEILLDYVCAIKDNIEKICTRIDRLHDKLKY